MAFLWSHFNARESGTKEFRNFHAFVVKTESLFRCPIHIPTVPSAPANHKNNNGMIANDI